MTSIDFEILMIAYAFDNDPVQIVDLAAGEQIPESLFDALKNKGVLKYAHNAAFERNAFNTYGIHTDPRDWRCSMAWAGACGLPLSLDKLSKVLDLQSEGKLATGKRLIKYFCTPCKPTKVNGGRHRNLWRHAPEKWEEFKLYCMRDVEAERAVCRHLHDYPMTSFEWKMYALDQKINDRGVQVDLELIHAALDIFRKRSSALIRQAKDLTGLDNPNSLTQLKAWLQEATGKEINSLAADTLDDLIAESSGAVRDVLEIRKKLSKTSVKKYVAMINGADDEDHRLRGLFQFNGAARTQRWAGRRTQVQNLPRTYLKDIDQARDYVKARDHFALRNEYESTADTLSQLIRTAFVAPECKTLGVVDFAAIEARVIAWYAGEQWRLDVFAKDGKIYEASASMMFDVPIEEVVKGSDLRAKGKVAELALGYQGGVNALKVMGGEAMGLNEAEMQLIVTKWREASPQIVSFWNNLNRCAIYAVKTKKPIQFKGLVFRFDGNAMTIQLPSGRKLVYWSAQLTKNKWDRTCVKYQGVNQYTGKWGWLSTYGGKLAENITQATARDLLALAMYRLDQKGSPIVMHVHDEVVCELEDEDAEGKFRIMCEIMASEVPWVNDLPLAADGFISKYYKKD